MSFAKRVPRAKFSPAAKLAALESTLDLLTPAVYFTDQQGAVVFMNSAARYQVSASKVLCLRDNHLVAVNGKARVALEAAIAQACDQEAQPPHGISVAISDGVAGLCATVLSLHARRHSDSRGAFAAAAVFVQDPTHLPTPPTDAFANLYGLTEAESRILLAMLPGRCAKKAAEILGISLATAKTHLQHIHAKTGTSKQTELMSLFLNSTLPINSMGKSRISAPKRRDQTVKFPQAARPVRPRL